MILKISDLFKLFVCCNPPLYRCYSKQKSYPMPNTCTCNHNYKSVAAIKNIQLKSPSQVSEDMEMASCEASSKVSNNEDFKDAAISVYENIN